MVKRLGFFIHFKASASGVVISGGFLFTYTKENVTNMSCFVLMINTFHCHLFHFDLFFLFVCYINKIKTHFAKRCVGGDMRNKDVFM